MDYKWTLSRPGISLEFETGSISEAIGLLETEGTQITTVFGFTMGAKQHEQDSTAIASGTVAAPSDAEKPARKPRAGKVDAVAPAPLPVPTAPEAPTTTLPPNALPTAPVAPADLTIPADGSVPAFLARPAAASPPSLPSPPLAPLPPSAPPVGVLGPKVVAALDAHKKGNVAADPVGQVLADWLHASGLSQKGATYDEACRVVLMTSDEKLKNVAAAFGVV